MPFTLRWTGMRGGETLTVDTATEALREYNARVLRVPKLTVEDDRGVKISSDDLHMIVYPDDEDENA